MFNNIEQKIELKREKKIEKLFRTVNGFYIDPETSEIIYSVSTNGNEVSWINTPKGQINAYQIFKNHNFDKHYPSSLFQDWLDNFCKKNYKIIEL